MFPSLSSLFAFRKRSWLVLVAVLLLHTAAWAQGGRLRQERLSRLENAKIAFLTDKLVLTQDQAQRFWPLYNEFTDKRRDLNRRQRQLRTNDPESLTDQQIRENLNQAFTMRQQEVNLEKEYFEKFQKVLSMKQVGRLYLAEREFTREVLHRLDERRNGPAPADGPAPR